MGVWYLPSSLLNFTPLNTLLISLTRKLGTVSYRAQVELVVRQNTLGSSGVFHTNTQTLQLCTFMIFITAKSDEICKTNPIEIHTSTINFYSCYSVLRYCHLITMSKEGVELGFVGTLWAHTLQPWGQLLGLFEVRSQHEKGDGSWCRSTLKDIYTLVKP